MAAKVLRYLGLSGWVGRPRFNTAPAELVQTGTSVYRLLWCIGNFWPEKLQAHDI
jgi:hypothetical protein